ncbi:MAG: ATP-binding protein [Deltaproteobacteria bacterium]|nr:ATP-binding protein [Deltaproteobacteria bacterium]
MHEILIISGKGGTGKTSLAAAFAHLADNPLICDLDVDAPDLHLILKPQHQRIESFYSGHEAIVLSDKCEDCGECIDVCRFGAISQSETHPIVNPFKCEGCKVCVVLCPAEAIDFPEKYCGRWYVSDTRFGPLVHAQLFPAEENSGRLVALLKKEAKTLAETTGRELILSDGPPGIGCPVISALSGTNLAVLVTEPTPSGLHDLVRVMSLCEHFQIPATVIINKFDLNPDQTNAIQTHCDGKGLRVIAKLPHDSIITEAMVQGKAVTEHTTGQFTELLREAWREIETLVKIQKKVQGSGFKVQELASSESMPNL